jgi:hypothetical protein
MPNAVRLSRLILLLLFLTPPAAAQEVSPPPAAPRDNPPFLLIPNFPKASDADLYKPTSSTVAQQPGRDTVVRPPLFFGKPGDDDDDDDDPAKRWEYRWTEVLRFQYTALPGMGSRGVSMNDFEVSSLYSIPTHPDLAPVEFTPGFTAHLWDGPSRLRKSPASPEFPLELYETYLDVGWRPRLARFLFLELGVTPSLNTDFKEISQQSFRPQARVVAIVATSKEFQFVGGWLYINRKNIHQIPAAGFLYNPNADVRLEMVFPQPKASFRLSCSGAREWWCYIGSEFGGGAWTAELPTGQDGLINYNDLRIRLGLENVFPKDSQGNSRDGWNLELGYTIRRNIDFLNVHPSNTLMVRTGFHF